MFFSLSEDALHREGHLNAFDSAVMRRLSRSGQFTQKRAQGVAGRFRAGVSVFPALGDAVY